MLRFYSSIFLIIFAGTPATTVFSGTSLVTTAPTAITAFSPTITPGQMVALAPIQAFFLISTGFNSSSFLCLGFKPW